MVNALTQQSFTVIIFSIIVLTPLSVSDGAMASRFNLYKSSGSIADSKKLLDMSLRKIKFVYLKTEALRNNIFNENKLMDRLFEIFRSGWQLQRHG